MIKRILITLAATLSILGLISTPALAGGTGNFYKSGACSPPYAGTTNARGFVTNYDVHSYADQEVHTSSRGGALSGFYYAPEATYVNGTKVATPEAYHIIGDIHAKVTVKFVWGYAWYDATCTVVISGG